MITILVIMAGVAVLGAHLFLNAFAEDGKSVGRNDAVWHVACKFSHQLPDDPILHYSDPGGAHMHDFYGNETTNAYSSTASLLGGPTTCNDSDDTASYWQPSLGEVGADSKIQWLKPSQVLPYYEYGGTDDTPQVQAFPSGLRMIAGDATSVKDLDTKFLYWQCVNQGGADEDKEKGPKLPSIPKDCGKDASGNRMHLTAAVDFPDCWDGTVLYKTGSTHMVYSGGTPAGGPDCPAGYIKVPQLHLRIHWNDFYGSSTAFVSSDLQTAAGTANHGRSLHADYWQAWNPARLKFLVAHCLNGGKGQGCPGADPPAGTLPAPYPQGKESIPPTIGDCAGSEGQRYLDGKINFYDLFAVLKNYGKPFAPCDFAPIGDPNGIVDDNDESTVLGHWKDK